MSRFDFKNVRLVIAEPVEQIRFGLRSTFLFAGFERIEDTGEISAVRDLIVNNKVDLLICDARLSEADSEDLVHQIRYREAGDNPFVPVITLVPTAEVQMIRKIIDSGTDDILVMPLVPKRLIERVVHLIRGRKPFVVTSDYIGPNRRKKHRPGTQEIPLIEVPNPLKALAEGEFDGRKLATEIDTAAKALNEQRIERDAHQIVYLVDRIVQIHDDEPSEERVLSHLERLASVTDEILTRLEGSAYGHWSGLCRSLADVMGRIGDAHMIPGDGDVRELCTLAEEFQIEIYRKEREVRIA